MNGYHARVGTENERVSAVNAVPSMQDGYMYGNQFTRYRRNLKEKPNIDVYVLFSKNQALLASWKEQKKSYNNSNNDISF